MAMDSSGMPVRSGGLPSSLRVSVLGDPNKLGPGEERPVGPQQTQDESHWHFLELHPTSLKAPGGEGGPSALAAKRTTSTYLHPDLWGPQCMTWDLPGVFPLMAHPGSCHFLFYSDLGEKEDTVQQTNHTKTTSRNLSIRLSEGFHAGDAQTSLPGSPFLPWNLPQGTLESGDWRGAGLSSSLAGLAFPEVAGLAKHCRCRGGHAAHAGAQGAARLSRRRPPKPRLSSWEKPTARAHCEHPYLGCTDLYPGRGS